jgi:DNA primase
MALISPESLERLKQTADIVEVISAHTDLRRQGARWVGLCPFHEERTPSFSVDAQEKLYHCFGCGVGGDVIKFVEEKEGWASRRRSSCSPSATGSSSSASRRTRGRRRGGQQRRRPGQLLARARRASTRYLLGVAEEAAKARRLPG